MAPDMKVLTLSIALCLFGLSSSSKFVPSDYENVVKDEYLVVLKTGLATDIINRVAQSAAVNGGHIQQKYVIGKNTIFRVRGGLNMVEKLALNDGVRVIEQNKFASLEKPVEEFTPFSPKYTTKAAVKAAEGEMKTCNEDFGGSDAWGIIRTSSRTKPDYNTEPYRWGTYKDDGTGVDIYILDSGIKMDHEDFAPFDKIEWGFTANYSAGLEDPFQDLNSHGTHVAGTTAGNKFGIARGANLVAVKVITGSGSAPWSDSIEGLEWIVKRVQQKKNEGKTTRSVVNMSLGSWAPEYALETAIQATIDAGVLVVTSAGNRANDTCTHTPQRMASIFTVAATDINDTLAYFTNYGPCTDIMAPGRYIMGPSTHNTTAYVLKSGTSMACPHVVGTVARYLSVLPDSKAAKMTPELIKAKLIDSATKGAIDLWSLEYESTPDRFLYKVCEDGEDDQPSTTTTPFPASSGNTGSTPTPWPSTTAATTSPPAEGSASAWTMEDIHGMTAASLGLASVTLCGSFITMTFLYCAIKQKRD